MSPSLEAPSREAARERVLVKVQAASGALFAVFLTLHLVNTALAVAGPAAYDGAQSAFRGVYQGLPLELVLVVAPLLVHVVASVWRMVHRRRRGHAPPPGLRARLHRWSGWFLLAFVFGHMAATRGAQLLFGFSFGFDGLAFTLTALPEVFAIYYPLLAIAGLVHGARGLAIGLPRLGLRLWSPARSGPFVDAVAVAGAVLLALGVATMAGAFYDVRARAVDSGPARFAEEQGLVDRAALARGD